mgnify:CR=1 FL=1|tara:strand:+ start:5348 stop:6205 length:858 start_codon:yes stop_codon:yes gene_type:complete
MASHDYVIDNQTAPNFRADLNNALLAIVSTNSGASAPAVTYANMLWYDTTNNLLRMRNEDNDAFITIGTLNQVADTFSPAGLIIASQAEAEAGVNNTNLMTPLRTAQAIDQRGAMALLSSTVISGTPTTIDFTFDPTLYDVIIFEFGNVITSTDSVSLQMRTSSNGGASFDAVASDYRMQRLLQLNGAVSGDTITASVLAIGGQNAGTAAGEEGLSGTAKIMLPGLAKRTRVLSQVGLVSNLNTLATTTLFGERQSSADVDAVRFLLSSGTFASGTITMYGMKSA